MESFFSPLGQKWEKCSDFKKMWKDTVDTQKRLHSSWSSSLMEGQLWSLKHIACTSLVSAEEVVQQCTWKTFVHILRFFSTEGYSALNFLFNPFYRRQIAKLLGIRQSSEFSYEWGKFSLDTKFSFPLLSALMYVLDWRTTVSDVLP